jgi:hypothetical protein
VDAHRLHRTAGPECGPAEECPPGSLGNASAESRRHCAETFRDESRKRLAPHSGEISTAQNDETTPECRTTTSRFTCILNGTVEGKRAERHALAWVAQHYAADLGMASTFSSSAQVPWPQFNWALVPAPSHAPGRQGIRRLQWTHKALHPIRASGAVVLAHQVLVNPLSVRVGVETIFDEVLKRLTLTDLAGPGPRGRNGCC